MLDTDNRVNIILLEEIKGGPGSGNFGHTGRPGKRGGSAPSITASFMLSARGLEKVRSIEKNFWHQTKGDGRERGAIMSLDGEVFDTAVGIEDSVNLDIEGAAEFFEEDSIALTHTHPVAVPFSPQDIRVFARFDELKVMRVMDSLGRAYSISKPRGWEPSGKDVMDIFSRINEDNSWKVYDYQMQGLTEMGARIRYHKESLAILLSEIGLSMETEYNDPESQ